MMMVLYSRVEWRYLLWIDQLPLAAARSRICCMADGCGCGKRSAEDRACALHGALVGADSAEATPSG